MKIVHDDFQAEMVSSTNEVKLDVSTLAIYSYSITIIRLIEAQFSPDSLALTNTIVPFRHPFLPSLVIPSRLIILMDVTSRGSLQTERLYGSTRHENIKGVLHILQNGDRSGWQLVLVCL
ncbi:hypothetical protein TNCV_4957991 [Trichonephila clavipes]|nr:hypothetical protein TNCV_4957991 [Trichonephila clavipes]